MFVGPRLFARMIPSQELLLDRAMSPLCRLPVAYRSVRKPNRHARHILPSQPCERPSVPDLPSMKSTPPRGRSKRSVGGMNGWLSARASSGKIGKPLGQSCQSLAISLCLLFLSFGHGYGFRRPQGALHSRGVTDRHRPQSTTDRLVPTAGQSSPPPREEARIC